MSDRLLRAAVIGLGAMGANHARVFAEMDGVELAAVCDTDADRVAGATRGRTNRGYPDYRLMLDEERPDLVTVAVPTALHVEVASEIIARGVPLLVEKPLAATVEDGVRLRDLAAAAGVAMTAGHIERFNPAVVELKRRLQAGELGRVLQVHARRVGPFPQRVRDVGVVLDLAPHDIDVMRFLLESEITRVHAETEQRINTDHEDMLIGTLRFANGVVGVLDINWLTPTKIRELSVLGERGMFVVDYLARELTFFENDAAPRGQAADWAAHHLKGVSEGPVHRLKVDKREPLRVELEAFVAAVRDNTAPAVTPDDAIAAIAVSEALVRSASTGAAVSLAGSGAR
ncbi:MAG TPA: Gfo/Idh/MocA family oxidoreductase [Dehalococcoidia bacterium]